MGLTALTEVAMSAGWHDGQDNAVARMQAAHSLSDLGDNAGAFMTEHDGQWLWYHAITHMQVAVTDASCLHTHQHLALTRRVQCDFLDDGRLSNFVQHSRFRFHSLAPPCDCVRNGFWACPRRASRSLMPGLPPKARSIADNAASLLFLYTASSLSAFQSTQTEAMIRYSSTRSGGMIRR